MRTLHAGLRVSDLEPSLAFYRAVGYTVIGAVEKTPFGSLTMLALPGDPFVTIELVHDPARGTVDLGTGFHHLVIQVDSLDATLADLAVKGIAADPPAGAGRADGPQTSWNWSGASGPPLLPALRRPHPGHRRPGQSQPGGSTPVEATLGADPFGGAAIS